MTSSTKPNELKADAFIVKPWAGTNPFYLMVNPDAAEPMDIDLDELGWKKKMEIILDMPGEWHLCSKGSRQVVFSLVVNPGDQPYYVGRHIGFAGTTSSSEVIAYGIGKKTQRHRKNAWHFNEDNLWVLPWGQVCGGTDVEYFAMKGLKAGLG